MSPTDLKNPAQSDPADEDHNALKEAESTATPNETSVDRESRRIAKKALRLGFDLSPLLLDQFKPEDEGETSATLGTEEIRQRALEVLHLLDEYHREKPWLQNGDTPNPIELDENTSLDDVLAQLNMMKRKDVPQVAQDTSESQFAIDDSHRKKIGERICALLSEPGVYQMLEDTLEKEKGRFTKAQPKLSHITNLRAVQAAAFEQIHNLSLQSQRRHGTIVGTAEMQIREWARIRKEAEDEEKKELSKANSVENGWIAAQTLLSYKREMKEDKFARTPSRVALLDDILSRFEKKPWQLLVGSNGTGKTELAVQALKRVCGGYHPLSGTESLSPQNIFGTKVMHKVNGDVVSGTKPGPATRAITASKNEPAGLLFDEANLVPSRTLYQFKFLFNKRRGDTVHIPEVDDDAVLPKHFGSIWTANPKDDRTPDREDFDAGINRVLGGIKVPFMTQTEQEHIVFAKLIDENGVLNLSRSEVEEVRNLVAAAVMTQQCFDRAFEDIGEEQLSEIRNMTGISDLRLTKKFLDPGRLMEMFDTFDQKRAEGVNTGDILANEVKRFLSEFEVKEEQNIALSILKLKGVIAPDSTAKEVRVTQTSKPNEKPYLLPSELGFLISEDGELVDDDVDFDEDLNASVEEILATDGARLLHDLNRSSTPNTSARSASVEQAAQTMLEKCGEGHFYGPDELTRTFPGLTLRPEDIPALPSPEEIERHATLGHTLRLRVSNAPDGSPLTMVKMREILQESFTENEDGEVLFNPDVDWKVRSEFFTQDTPELAWSFTSDDVLPDSTSKNHLQQTELLADYVRQSLFSDGQMPEEFQEALEELEAQKDEIAGLIQSDWQEAAKRLSRLKLNQLLRATPVESLCDLMVTFQNSSTAERKRLLRSMYTWSSTLSSDGRLVSVGRFDSGGVDRLLDHPGYSDDGLGVVLSRKFLRPSTA